MITIILIHFLAFVVLLFVIKLKTCPKEMLIDYVRTLICLSIGCFILSPLIVDINWDKLTFNTTTQIKVGCGQRHLVWIIVHVDLTGLYIHVDGSTPNDGCLMNENMYFVEKYQWYRYSGRHLKDHLIKEKMAPAPKPVLEILEQFLTSTERYRTYEIFGWYCQVCLWGAFFIYLAALILFRIDLFLGICFLFTAGGLQLLTALVWLLGSYLTELKIHFEDLNFQPKLGFGFWISICGGILCITASFILLFLQKKFKATAFMLFEIDAINSKEDRITMPKSRMKVRDEETVELDTYVTPLPEQPNESDEGDYEYL